LERVARDEIEIVVENVMAFDQRSRNVDRRFLREQPRIVAQSRGESVQNQRARSEAHQGNSRCQERVMLSEGACEEIGGPTWDQNDEGNEWREVDRALRGIAKQRAALDADEARWLREAERFKIWRPLGMVSALDYLERVLGYAPHTAFERMRVARELGALPALEEAFECGELGFSAIRELTRVATPETESEWRDKAIGKTVREVEEAVAGRRRGMRPSDPPEAELCSRTVRFELGPETFARLRQARVVLSDECGRHLDGDELVAALCEAVLDRAPVDASGAAGEPTGRAKFQIALVVCEACKQAWQEGAGVKIAVDAATVERAQCDAQHIGSIDGDAPERAHQDIPPSVVRFVWRRDGGRCQTRGCRSARGIEIHHIVRRTDGGTHEPANLTLRCSSCHAGHHRGTLTISGTAPDRLEVRRHHDPNTRPSDLAIERPSDPPRASATLDAAVVPEQPDANVTASRGAESGTAFGGATRLDAAVMRAQARDALVQLGWKQAIARTAVDVAMSHVGSAATLEIVIREALRRCPMPRT
jgi:hypothetical protein